MDQNNNNDPKTWTLAQRARKVSKGQAKIFMTRKAGDEQRLAKLTQFLDKEKMAKTSELNFAQKLLVKRYGPGKSEAESAGEHVHRRVTRDRSVTFDSTFITRPDIIIDGNDHSESRKISSAHSSGSLDVPRKTSNTHSPNWGESARKYSTTKPLGEITRKCSSTQPEGLLLTRGTASTNTKGSVRFSRWDDLHIGRHAPMVSQGDTQATRPCAVSLIHPPLILPPIYKTDGQRSPHTGGGLRSRYSTSHIRNTGAESGHTRKTSLGSYGNTAVGDRETVEFDNSLYSCRYLRRNNDNEDM